jgi:hypothetical protein
LSVLLPLFPCPSNPPFLFSFLTFPSLLVLPLSLSLSLPFPSPRKRYVFTDRTSGYIIQ